MRTFFAIFAGLIAINIALKLMDYAGVGQTQIKPASGTNGYYTVTHQCAPDLERRSLSQGSRFYIEQIFLVDLQVFRDIDKYKDLKEDVLDKEIASVSKDRLLKYVELIPASERMLVSEILRELKTREDVKDCLSKYTS
ncbi:hypothetical protein [Rhizobium sp. C1]|uniref:hypothetical protein n=1 Tax=Rhizobium sp. C1 TaxID=1349799 RepID=UPI001E519383|nr:hypothetical protein [Rhizobium sp. C1]MCD2177589.1 hypothetical protein [Rhizobium sp. C1]